MTSLHLHARTGDEKAAVPHLTRENIHATDKLRRTPLHLSSWAGKRGFTALLLSHGADPKAKCIDATTALHFASQNGHAACVKLLLDAPGMDKAGINAAQTKTGKTALHLAVLKDRIECAQLLLRHGADHRITTKKGVKLFKLPMSAAMRAALKAEIYPADAEKKKQQEEESSEGAARKAAAGSASSSLPPPQTTTTTTTTKKRKFLSIAQDACGDGSGGVGGFAKPPSAPSLMAASTPSSSKKESASSAAATATASGGARSASSSGSNNKRLKQ